MSTLKNTITTEKTKELIIREIERNNSIETFAKSRKEAVSILFNLYNQNKEEGDSLIEDEDISFSTSYIKRNIDDETLCVITINEYYVDSGSVDYVYVLDVKFS